MSRISIDNASANAQATSAIRRFPAQIEAEKIQEKDPPFNPVYMTSSPNHNLINILRAGVAQLVERVALITAKRSTSRSWVRAPPSAIPISKLIRAAVLLLFCSFDLSVYISTGLRLAWHLTELHFESLELVRLNLAERTAADQLCQPQSKVTTVEP
jgi:hypothetical protein